MDRNVVQAMVRLMASDGAPLEEQCAAVANQIAAISAAREAHLRCYPAGPPLDALVAVLDTSVRDLRQMHATLGCASSAGLGAATLTA